ncbi:response regulator [Pleomorphomonas sp. NRK KF1]|uniref:response regulator n=1 Tax=Pleomorphomonas sp. NRK KF1 TaxID=2943000 RepID=UPI002043E6D5|nr:response regulator [Pleomorphomonas sp. NRK KF1]MCM5554366.1 response regulator [Pleomorphomonas sp. NRK KF1]
MPMRLPPASPSATSGGAQAILGGRRLVGHLMGRRTVTQSIIGESDYPTSDETRPVALVVDDSPIARMLIASILESFEVDVYEAGGSAEAQSVVATCRPDVVIVDWTLRSETATDVLDALEARFSGELPPVVMISASARMPTELRATATLRKPFTPRELYAALAAAFSGKGSGAAEA